MSISLDNETWARLRQLGPFAGVVQVAPTASDHELLRNPVQRGAAPAPLRYHGGRTITAPRVLNVYLDAFPDSTADFDAFTKALVENGYYLSPDGADAANGVGLPSVTLASGMSGMTSDTALEAFIEAKVAAGALPPVDPNTLFSVIFPPTLGIAFADGSGASCSAFCGYHSRTRGKGYYYAVICDPGCSGCHGGFTPQQARMMVQAHEYGE